MNFEYKRGTLKCHGTVVESHTLKILQYTGAKKDNKNSAEIIDKINYHKKENITYFHLLPPTNY